MKSVARLLAILLFAAGVAHGQQSPADEIESVRSRYKLEFDQLASAEAAALAPASAAYLQELAKLKSTAQGKGDLKAVLEFDAVITAANTGSPEEPPAAANAGVRIAFANYQRNKAFVLRPLAAKRQQLEAGYTRAFTTLEQQYTRSGQIEAAKIAHDALASAPNAETEVIANMSGAVLKGREERKSEKSYKPPIEVEWRFETSGEVRLAYACDQLIFNWGNSPSELRIDGGPANGQHKKGAGAATKDKPITVKLTVLPKQMVLSVDGRERARWTGNFSAVNQPVSIRSSGGSVTVKVDQVTVRKLR